MTTQDFDKLVERRVELIKSVLKSKAGEYASLGDRLHNFNRAADMLGTTKEKALVGMWTKHIVSVLDIVDSGSTPRKELIDEKIGDLINYAILLEACYMDRVSETRLINGGYAEKCIIPAGQSLPAARLIIKQKDFIKKIDSAKSYSTLAKAGSKFLKEVVLSKKVNKKKG